MTIETTQRGFTLIELLIGMALIGILMALAVPSFQELILSSRLTTSSNDLLTTFSQARSKAITLGRRVTVCPSTNGTQCSSGGWQQGWIMFDDVTRATATPSVDTGETVTLSVSEMGSGMVVKGNLPYVSFAADGQPRLLLGGFLSGKLRICNTSEALGNNKRARDFTLNSAGRFLVERPANISALCPAP